MENKREARMERRMERFERFGRKNRSSNVWPGLFLLVIGGLWLAKTSGVFFPYWFFTWPMLLIAIGVFSGIRHGFRGIGWMIPLGIGLVFLLNRIYAHDPLRHYFLPFALIAAGLIVIFRPGRRRRINRINEYVDTTSTLEDQQHWEQAMADQNDVIDITAVFGGVKKKMLTKKLKGGEIVCFMGGSEIDLTQADFNGRIMIDCFNMFGGTKLLVPPDWDVQSQIVAVFGGVDDKRPPASRVDPDKVLFLEGTCIFGGVEIRSY